MSGTQAVPAWRAAYLRALERRIADQPSALQALLRRKLEASPVQEVASPPARAAAPQQSPLAQLNAGIRAAQAERLAVAPGEPAPDPDELASARRFREAWDSGRTLDEVERALARKPAQAGPLNSHMLVLQSLAMMRSLSTDYLRHFLVHVETLQWLEQLAAGARRARTGKSSGA